MLAVRKSIAKWIPLKFLPGISKSLGTVAPVDNNTASKSSRILLTDVSQYDKITQGLLELGINGINSVQFKSSEMEKYESQARIKAIKNAKAKAEEYAEALGVKVGAPIFISESSTGNYPQPQMMRMVDMKESSASGNQTLAVGEMEIMAQVTVNFAIIQ